MTTNILIAYFSRKGENYINGKIVDLPVCNTEIVANIIHKITGGDIFRIETDYHIQKIITKLPKSPKRN